jgi:hypothetical protein
MALTWKTEPTKKKKKPKYSYVLKFPANKQTGWQETVMDINSISDRLEAARGAITQKL